MVVSNQADAGRESKSQRTPALGAPGGCTHLIVSTWCGSLNFVTDSEGSSSQQHVTKSFYITKTDISKGFLNENGEKYELHYHEFQHLKLYYKAFYSVL